MKSTKAKKNSSAPVVTPPVQPQVVLLAVTGMTPAVLTETIWALAHEKTPAIPDRVVAITTPKGKARMERELFEPASEGQENLWQTLRREILGADYQSDGRLSHEYEVISATNAKTGRKEALEDFRNSEENAAMADFVLEQVRGFVETPGVQLITSIAGGRKTLGALLYACMSLVGRETDRLTHVLVNEPFDSPDLEPRFYFPPQPIQSLKTAKGTVITAKNAAIDLGDIPFVPLRNLFERDLISKPCSFTELVKRCKQKVIEAAQRNIRLTLWRSRREIEINGVKIAPSTLQQVLLLFLADPATRPALAQIKVFKDAINPLREFAAALHSRKPRENVFDWRCEAILPAGFNEDNIRKLLNELKDKLSAAGPAAHALDPLLPVRGRFSLDLPPSAIKVRD